MTPLRVAEPTIYEIHAESYAVEDKIEMLTATLRSRGRFLFVELLTGCRSRSEMVVTFIALLELIKLGEALIVQEETFGDIMIVASEPGDSDRAPVATDPSA